KSGAQAEATCTDLQVARHVVRRDAAYRQQWRIRRQHRTPRLYHRWPKLFGRKKLERIRALRQGCERLAGGGDAWQKEQAGRPGGAQHLRIAMGHDDDLAASGLHLLDLGWR